MQVKCQLSRFKIEACITILNDGQIKTKKVSWDSYYPVTRYTSSFSHLALFYNCLHYMMKPQVGGLVTFGIWRCVEEFELILHDLLP